MLKRRSSIIQASVEKHPAIQQISCCSISKGHRNDATRKGDPINPREPRAAACRLFLHHPPPRLVYDCVPALTKLANQCRFTAARAPGDDDNRSTLLLQSTHWWRICPFVGRKA